MERAGPVAAARAVVRSLGWDLPLAVALAALGQAEAWTLDGAFPRALVALLYLVLCGGLAVRRRHPLGAAALAAVAGNLAIIAGAPRREVFVPLIAFLVVSYSVAAHAERRAAWAGLTTVVVVNWAGVLLSAGSQALSNYALILLLLGGAWGAGRANRHRVLEAVAFERRALAAEHAREDAARAAVAEERGRIARELHDIVAHGLSLMIVQAGAAERTAPRDPARAAAAMRAVQDAGRDALSDMRRLLDVLRVPELEGDGATLAPQPSLENVDRLIGQVAEAGVEVDLHVEGRRRELPPALDLCGYRVLQEALTNSLRHGHPGRVRVLLRYQQDELEVEVHDDGAGAAGQQGPRGPVGTGRGLLGMRERVSLFGGELQTGSVPGGGYRVRARIPLSQP